MNNCKIEVQTLLAAANKAQAEGSMNRAGRRGLKKLVAMAAAGVTSIGISASAFAAAPVADVAALLTGIDFTTALTAILGIVAAGIVFFMAKGGGVQVMHFVKRILGA